MQALPPPSPRDQPLPAISLGCIPISYWREEGRLGSSPWRALNTGDTSSATSFKESFSFPRLTIVQGQGPQYPSKMSLDIFGRMGAVRVVKQLCRNPNCPLLKMEKAPAKEGGCIWLLKMKSRAPYHVSCCLIWTSHAPLCTYDVTLNHSLLFQSAISFLSSNRLSTLWGRENMTFHGAFLCLLEGGKLANERGPTTNQ